MVTVVDFQLTIPGGMAFSFSRGSRVSMVPWMKPMNPPDRFLNLEEFLKEPRFTKSNEPLPQFLA
jgi:hypothetical protein